MHIIIVKTIAHTQIDRDLRRRKIAQLGKHGRSIVLEKKTKCVEVISERAQRAFQSDRKGKVILCRGAEDGKVIY